MSDIASALGMTGHRIVSLDLVRRGQADLVFVHDKVAELKFLRQSYGVPGFDVMYNDFVLVGPKSDPAKMAGGNNIVDALKKISATHLPFVSRGDRGGTNAKELRLWRAVGIADYKINGQQLFVPNAKS